MSGVNDQENLSRRIDRFFQISARGSTPQVEVLAGITTFATMAYVLAVNPMILADAGMDRGEMITATAIAAGVFSLLMVLLANLPLAQAPGMGANALFANTLVLSQGIPWEAALGLVFWSGGRTGLTAVCVGLLFLVALFVTPLILIIPVEATAPALMIIGILMFSEVRHIQFEDLTTAAPAVLTIFFMPITSISDGLALGLISYVCIMVLTGRFREMTWLTYGLAASLAAYYAFAL